MIDLSNRKIAEILYIANTISDTGKEYFLQGYLLGKL